MQGRKITTLALIYSIDGLLNLMLKTDFYHQQLMVKIV